MKTGNYCYVMKNENQKIVATTSSFSLNGKDTKQVIDERREMVRVANEKYPDAKLFLQLVHAAFVGKIED